jgi:hypothetical protein
MRSKTRLTSEEAAPLRQMTGARTLLRAPLVLLRAMQLEVKLFCAILLLLVGTFHHSSKVAPGVDEMLPYFDSLYGVLKCTDYF